MDFMESWLRLAEKLVDATSILESTHPLSVPPPSQANGKKLLFNPLFNPLAFVIETQKAIHPCLRKLFHSRVFHRLHHKVVDLLLSTIRHIYSSEKVSRRYAYLCAYLLVWENERMLNFSQFSVHKQQKANPPLVVPYHL